jgi:hypothetical protein
MQDVSLQDLVISSAKGIEVGATATTEAVFLLIASAITIIGGVEGLIFGGILGGTMNGLQTTGLLAIGIGLIVLQQFQKKYSAAQNVAATRNVGIIALALGIVLQICVIKAVPGFASSFPGFGLTIHHLSLIAGVCLITAGISGLLCARQIKGVLNFIEQMFSGSSS